MTDRLAEIIQTLEQLDIVRALQGIDRCLPGWPSGNTGGSSMILDPDGHVALTKVEATATTVDAALRASVAYPRLCADVLIAAETIAAAYVTQITSQPDRMVRNAITVLKHATTQNRPLDDRNVRRCWNLTMTLRDQTIHWARCATPGMPKVSANVGLETTDPRWCTSCLRLGHCEPRSQHHTRCRFCLGFHATYQTDPPPMILTRHHRGERITDRDITVALKRKAS
jgi:hypothetical protein